MKKPRKTGEGVDYLTCRLCRREYKAITSSHLVRKHEFDPEHPILEYRQRFRLKTANSIETQRKRRYAICEWKRRKGQRLNREEVVRLLGKEKTAGRSLAIHSVGRRFHALQHAACRHFGTWRKALRAAGLQPDPPRIKRKWTRETAIASIRKIPSSVPLNKIRVRDPHLFQAASRLFGGWPAAVKAAGRIYPPQGGPWKWTNERIFETIRKRARQGASIRYSAISREHPGLLDAALDRFGSWKEAVAAASCTRYLPTRRKHWSRNELIKLLRKIRGERGSVTYTALSRVERAGYVSPVSSVVRLFGTLAKARVAVGLPRLEWRPRVWNKARILSFIRSRARRGLALGLGPIAEGFGGLAAAARREFGSWRKAVESVRMGHRLRPQVFRWTKDRIVGEISRIARKGGSIEQRDIRKTHPGLERYGVKRFGFWEAAVRAAGCANALSSPPRHWTRKELVQLLKTFWRKTGRLPSDAIKRHKRPGTFGPLYSITKVFGSFPAAKRAAGLGHIPSHSPRRWHRRAILDELRSRVHRPGALAYTALEHEVKGILEGARREFGSLHKAYRAAKVSRVDRRRKVLR